ncbi:MAG: nicotinate-nucleotide adenylyltransferase [Bryobacteraceae bacterium]|nr:nicotinate-nucleotide adenylyltransferase [Bryobacteraceae bacterium]
MRIAIFGGTFDPIHTAHLTVAREAMKQVGLDRVLFVPAAHPPHKSGSTEAGYEDRFRMLELACGDDPAFIPSRLEEEDRKSYSVLTIEKLRASLAPEDEIFFLIGADAFAEITTWYRWEDVIRQVTFIVVTRPGHHYQAPPGARVVRLETLALPVSSSEIRANLAAGRPAAELPQSVRQYIDDRGLYGAPTFKRAT